MIQDNIIHIQNRIKEAELRSGRPAGSAKLIAVSKTKPVSMIQEAYAAGVRDFGENKAQELAEKYEELPKDIRWHMIGHLQRNKVKYVVGRAALIHSVDSLRLAEEISRVAGQKKITADILIEINASCEESKFGAEPGDAPALISEISRLPYIHIRGLMTVAPNTENPEENRKYFRYLKKLSVDMSYKNADNVSMDILSMGMTNDFEVAVEEGSVYVRVGTGIFGVRNSSVSE